MKLLKLPVHNALKRFHGQKTQYTAHFVQSAVK